MLGKAKPYPRHLQGGDRSPWRTAMPCVCEPWGSGSNRNWEPGRDLTLMGVGSPHQEEPEERALGGREMRSLLWKEVEDKSTGFLLLPLLLTLCSFPSVTPGFGDSLSAEIGFSADRMKCKAGLIPF